MQHTAVMRGGWWETQITGSYLLLIRITQSLATIYIYLKGEISTLLFPVTPLPTNFSPLNHSVLFCGWEPLDDCAMQYYFFLNIKFHVF